MELRNHLGSRFFACESQNWSITRKRLCGNDPTIFTRLGARALPEKPCFFTFGPLKACEKVYLIGIHSQLYRRFIISVKIGQQVNARASATLKPRYFGHLKLIWDDFYHVIYQNIHKWNQEISSTLTKPLVNAGNFRSILSCDLSNHT